MIIGIAGTIGSGKGTVVSYLKEKGFAHYSSSAILKDLLREQGLPQTREYMSPLAHELMQQYPGGILSLSHARALQDGVTDYVLEAIHRVSEEEYVRSIGGFVIGIDAPVKHRYERSIARGEGEKDQVTYEQFLEHAEREDEGQGETGAHIRAVLRNADIVLMNDGTIAELQAQVETALTQLRKLSSR